MLITVCIVLFSLSDRESPVITVDEEYLKNCDLNDEAAVLAAVTAVDNETEQVKVMVVDIASLENQTYKIQFAARDDAGNSATTFVTVENATVLEKDMQLEGEETTEADTAPESETAQEVITEEPTTELVTVSPDSPVVRLTAEKVSMNVGDTFNYMDYIDSITDDKDEELELYRRIRVEGYYNTNAIGDYPVDYFVKDSDGNKSNVATIVLKVRDNNQQ